MLFETWNTNDKKWASKFTYKEIQEVHVHIFEETIRRRNGTSQKSEVFVDCNLHSKATYGTNNV